MMPAQRPIFDPERISVPRIVSAGERTFTVSQLNALIKRVLGDQLPGTIHLIGQISNLTRHTSGHVYLTLKDDRGEIRCVMWRSVAAAVKFELQDGLEVVATGHVDVYENRGQYQFYIRRLEPKGTGSLELALRQLRERLEREGLFDPRRRKPIPRFPRHIVLVTSPTGAVVHDMLDTLRRRWPCARVSLHPVRVQGEGAARDIAEAIARLNQYIDILGGIDVMIVGRGGGSLEDLWAFNEEIVARAIHASRIPIISAVGHEVDVTIADLVADLRAATPTAAAELAAPLLDEVLETLAGLASRLRRGARHRVDRGRSRLDLLGRSAFLRDPLGLVRQRAQRVDELVSRLRLVLGRALAEAHRRLHYVENALSAIQPRALVHWRYRRVSDLGSRLQWMGTQRLGQARKRLHRLELRLAETEPRSGLRRRRDALGDSGRQLGFAVGHRVAVARASLEGLAARLEASSYRKTLSRGYTITRGRRTGRVISAADQVRPDEEVLTETADGSFASRVVESPAAPAPQENRRPWPPFYSS